ncbi:unnamed protein product [Brugia pahangi]|uniref:Secreted protein n=1 Tax=Brugia pahangi TaxID=6280 RepID=A0A0N4T7T9_BRUPA|nr:unnamed protein product [Brugia pahangi]
MVALVAVAVVVVRWHCIVMAIHQRHCQSDSLPNFQSFFLLNFHQLQERL